MVNGRISISLIYDSLGSVLIRFFAINGLFILIAYEIFAGSFPRVPLFLLSLITITHIFIRYEIENILPNKKVSGNLTDTLDCFTKEALMVVLLKNNSESIVNYLKKRIQIKFYLEKAAINPNDLKAVNFPKQDLYAKALEIAKTQNNSYVTSIDLFTAYLLLTENQTKLLFSNKLKEEDILSISHWTKVTFDEENIKPKRARFVGIGIGETLVWGWTPETKNYTKDLTFSSVRKRGFIEGREKEYKNMLEAMQRKENNNVLLVGDIGTGKGNLVDNFIFDSYEANLSKRLNHRRFLEVTIGPLVAGTANREELETRLQAIIEEVKHSGNVILYIPEFQNLIGSSSYEIDLSGAILPYLKDGKMPIIATMTEPEYKKYFENNAIKEVFEIIKLGEPNEEDAIKMLFHKAEEIENDTKTQLSYRAVLSALKYADKFDVNAVLPGTAVELLTETANSVYLENRKEKIVLEEDVLGRVEAKSHIPVGQPKSEEKLLLLNLENEMHKFVIGQDEAIRSISEAIRRIRAGLSREKPISFLFLGPTGVGKTETARTLAKIYFGGEANIVRVDMSEYGNPDSINKMLESDSGSFLNQIETHPFSLVLLDEFEKANEKILNLFLQVFEDGRMTDNGGKTISFTNTIIISTSNAGSEFIRENLANNSEISNNNLLDFLQRGGVFTPELLNRYDDIVVFHPLNHSQVSQIAKLLLAELSGRLSQQDITLSFDPQAVEFIARGGFNEEFGARPLKRFIQDKVEDVMAKKMLSGEVVRGDRVNVTLDQSSNLAFTKAT